MTHQCECFCHWTHSHPVSEHVLPKKKNAHWSLMIKLEDNCDSPPVLTHHYRTNTNDVMNSALYHQHSCHHGAIVVPVSEQCLNNCSVHFRKGKHIWTPETQKLQLVNNKLMRVTAMKRSEQNMCFLFPAAVIKALIKGQQHFPFVYD